MWQRLPVCFELVSPLHIGFLPNDAGTVVSPTRLYVPGKALWGAVTAALTPRVLPSPTPGDFKKVADQIRAQIVFSYLYLSDGKSLYAPSYKKGELHWGEMPDRDFRAAFLESRMSTQIGCTGAAEDGGLHEVELVRCRTGSAGQELGPVYLCGMAWLEEGAEIAGASVLLRNGTPTLDAGTGALPLFDGLTLGGERNYGCGRVKPAPIPTPVRGRLDKLWPRKPQARFSMTGPLPGHAHYRRDVPFQGALEIVAGREYSDQGTRSFQSPGVKIRNAGYFFAPGTIILDTQIQFEFDSFGQFTITKEAADRSASDSAALTTR